MMCGVKMIKSFDCCLIVELYWNREFKIGILLRKGIFWWIFEVFFEIRFFKMIVLLFVVFIDVWVVVVLIWGEWMIVLLSDMEMGMFFCFGLSLDFLVLIFMMILLLGLIWGVMLRINLIFFSVILFCWLFCLMVELMIFGICWLIWMKVGWLFKVWIWGWFRILSCWDFWRVLISIVIFWLFVERISLLKLSLLLIWLMLKFEMFCLLIWLEFVSVWFELLLFSEFLELKLNFGVFVVVWINFFVRVVMLLVVDIWVELVVVSKLFSKEWLNSIEFWIFIFMLNLLVVFRLIFVIKIWINIFGGCLFNFLISFIIFLKYFGVVFRISLLLIGLGMMMIFFLICW